MHSDEATTVAALRQLIAQFVAERDWRQFHAPKNLCMALSIEVSELMEHFQWLSVDESRELAADAQRLEAVRQELADVLGYTLALANELGIDLSSAVQDKMKLNELKYPVEEIRGRYGHNDPRRPQAASGG
jgi:dCTP diphosphatase